MENPEKSQNKRDEHGRRLRTPSGGIGMPGKRAGRAGDSGMRAHSDIRTEQGDVFAGLQNGAAFWLQFVLSVLRLADTSPCSVRL